MNEQTENSQTVDSPQNVPAARTRARKYSTDECNILMEVCDKYHAIINNNSIRDADKIEKAQTWKKIKTTFETRCRNDGIFVSYNWRCIFFIL